MPPPHDVGDHRCHEFADGCRGQQARVSVGEQEMPTTDQGEGERVDVGVGPERGRELFVGLRLADELGEDASAGCPRHHLDEREQLAQQVGADVAGVWKGERGLHGVKVPVRSERSLRRPTICTGSSC